MALLVLERAVLSVGASVIRPALRVGQLPAMGWPVLWRVVAYPDSSQVSATLWGDRWAGEPAFPTEHRLPPCATLLPHPADRRSYRIGPQRDPTRTDVPAGGQLSPPPGHLAGQTRQVPHHLLYQSMMAGLAQSWRGPPVGQPAVMRWASAIISCAASDVGERTSSGVCVLMLSRTFMSRRMMPASCGLLPRNLRQAASRVS